MGRSWLAGSASMQPGADEELLERSWSHSRQPTLTLRAFEIFTGSLSTAALALYGSLGYEHVRVETVAPDIDLMYMEKRRD